MNPTQHTRVARLSPPGVSAIACLGVAGPEAWSIVRELFRGKRTLPLVPIERSTYFGAFGEGVADDVVLFVRSVAPSPSIEIQCHGGREVVRMIEDTLVRRGAEVVESSRFANDEIADLLSRCLTVRTAAIALDQWNGACDRELSEIDALHAAGRHDEAAQKLAHLQRQIPVGKHLVEPWRVALVGEPNVGKSSLVNALAGFTRSVVSPTPGTTRDVVRTNIAADGWPIELIDTAGLRDAEETLEAAGIARGRSASASADLILRVIDAASPMPKDFAQAELLVVNKIDQAPASPSDVREAVLVSAKSGEGIDRLIAAIVGRLIPSPPKPGEAVPMTDDHRRRFAAAVQASADHGERGAYKPSEGLVPRCGPVS